MSVRISTNKRWGFLEVDIRVRLPDGTRYRERAKAPVQSRSGAKVGRGAGALPGATRSAAAL